MTMNFDDAAAVLARRVRATGHGFLTLRRDELRDAFGIGRLTEAQSKAISLALQRCAIVSVPHPFESGPSLRLYDHEHPLARIIEAVLLPDTIPETPLRQVAASFAREHAGRELRSDDVPWPLAFDLFLQVVLGRDSEEWEELRDDRHPSELARTLAQALGFPTGLADRPSTLRIAAAVGPFRPRRRSWVVSEFVPEGDETSQAQPLLEALQTAQVRLGSEFGVLLHQAARLLLASDVIPQHPVELGMLGLRYRREGAERAQG
ncbi:MAG: hypothetical protein EOO74_02120 [Myxococcales bacterium]|nr:MAG: hypothetical protein EOO74_02120 [Myxococcales bacterium]